jgi:CheY-like chemotaxis protein
MVPGAKRALQSSWRALARCRGSTPHDVKAWGTPPHSGLGRVVVRYVRGKRRHDTAPKGSAMESVRIAVVDTDEWVRRGRVDALRSVHGVVVVRSDSAAEALRWREEWDDVDVVLVSASRTSSGFDRFPAVGVVESVRLRRSTGQTRVVAVAEQSHRDLLRARLGEAGADFMYSTGQLRTVPELVDALQGDASAALTPRPSRLNATLAFISAVGLQDAFMPGQRQKQLALSRRQVITLRWHLSQFLGLLEPPPWRDLVEQINRARGVSEEGRGDRPSRP